MFDIDRHVIGDISPDEFEGGKVFSGLDFGFHDPTVNLWMGYKDGIFYILDEHYERRLPYAPVLYRGPFSMDKMKELTIGNSVLCKDIFVICAR